MDITAHHGNLCLARAHAWKFMPCKGTCMEIYALQGRSYHWGNCLSKSFSPSITCNSLDFLNSLYHAIDMLKFSHGSASVKKYTLATPLPWRRYATVSGGNWRSLWGPDSLHTCTIYNSENAKVNEEITGTSQSSSRAALKVFAQQQLFGQ